jgi:hypothetical protein
MKFLTTLLAMVFLCLPLTVFANESPKDESVFTKIDDLTKMRNDLMKRCYFMGLEVGKMEKEFTDLFNKRSANRATRKEILRLSDIQQRVLEVQGLCVRE